MNLGIHHEDFAFSFFYGDCLKPHSPEGGETSKNQTAISYVRGGPEAEIPKELPPSDRLRNQIVLDNPIP